MNFLSHAIPYFSDPLVAVCTAVPDWLSVIDRRVRARRRMAEAVMDSTDADLRQVAKGILNHIHDDRWFHTTPAFVQTNLELAVSLRDLLPNDRGFRPMFVGHIVIEMLLDSIWLREQPQLGEQYYEMVEAAPADLIQRCVNQITGKPTEQLVPTIQRYSEAKFLYDYLQPEGMLLRLNQVLRRVSLVELPDSLIPWLQQAGELVEFRRVRFLTKPDGSTHFPTIP